MRSPGGGPAAEPRKEDRRVGATQPSVDPVSEPGTILSADNHRTAQESSIAAHLCEGDARTAQDVRETIKWHLFLYSAELISRMDLERAPFTRRSRLAHGTLAELFPTKGPSSSGLR